jgi:hypothetical protein
MMKFLLVPVFGKVELLELPDDERLVLGLSTILDGAHVTVVPAGDKWIMCDEDGESRNLPINMRATILLNKWFHGRPVLGDVLLCGNDDGKFSDYPRSEVFIVE